LAKNVSFQLYQQKAVGQLPRIFAGAEPSTRAIKAGRAMSLAYMSAISATDTYKEFKDAGASDRAAGLGMIGSMAAMFSLMQVDYFREGLFRGTYLDESLMREPVKELGEFAKNKLFSEAALATQKGALTAVKKTMDKIAHVGSKALQNRYV